MSNHTGKFLTQWQMGEAKHSEAIQNAIQKRKGTNHPLSNIIAWSCGCCIGPALRRDKTILTPAQADAILKARKRRNRIEKQHSIAELRNKLSQLPSSSFAEAVARDWR